jgi:rod shape-determining protein MreC
MIVNNTYYQRAIIIKTSNRITGSVNKSFNTISEYFFLRKTNKLLADENARLHNLMKDAYMGRDVTTFTRNDTIYLQQYQYISAKVIGNSVNKRNNYLLLNKGWRHGIQSEMAVISSQGVVGIVKDASDNFCSVMSVLNSQSHISAKIKKNNQTGTVIWDGPDYRFGTLKDIPGHVLVDIGDSIVSSGYSQIFPEGIMVGIITDYSLVEGNNFYIIQIKFSVDYNQLCYVEVVKDLLKKEKQTLENVSSGE